MGGLSSEAAVLGAGRGWGAIGKLSVPWLAAVCMGAS